MAEDHADETSKTEDPTAKRLSEARSKGQMAVSQEVKVFFMMLGMVIFLMILSPLLAAGMTSALTPLIAQADQLDVRQISAASMVGFIFAPFGWILLVVAITAFFFSVYGSYFQIGNYFNWARLKIDFARLNPMEGMKRLFNVNAVIELWKTTAKFFLMGGVMLWLLYPESKKSEGLVGADVAAMMEYLYDIVLHIATVVLAIHLLITLADHKWVNFDYIKKLRMTKSEVKDERRQSEGDPKIKQKLFTIRVKRARQRMMAAVPQATVVITNPTHFAVALKYESGAMAAPICVAKGMDSLARRIRELAQENNVPVVENPPLARTLFATVEVDDEIPIEQYRAVAEVISFIFQKRQKPAGRP